MANRIWMKHEWIRIGWLEGCFTQHFKPGYWICSTPRSIFQIPALHLSPGGLLGRLNLVDFANIYKKSLLMEPCQVHLGGHYDSYFFSSSGRFYGKIYFPQFFPTSGLQYFLPVLWQGSQGPCLLRRLLPVFRNVNITLSAWNLTLEPHH